MKRFLLSVLLACGLFAGLANAQTLIVGQSGLPVTLDTGQDGNSLTPAYQILEPLVLFKQSSAEIKEGLATSWEPNEDATSWTFKLREGVMFQDGTPFNADAVKFNFDRWNNRDNEYAFADQGKDFTSFTYIFGAFKGQDGYLLDSVDVVDENTVTFNLTQAIGYFPQLVASSYFGMHSPTAVMNGGLEYGTPNVA